MSDSPILKVAVNVPLSRAFDYLPARDNEVPQPGCRVLVPFGRRRQTGLVLAHARHSELPAGKIRRSIATLDSEPLLRTDDLRLLRFTSDYYHHPIGEVVATALPALLRQGKPLYPEIEALTIAPDGEGTDVGALARRAPRQAGLVELLQDAGGNGIDAATLSELLPNWRRIAKPLIEKGLVLRYTTRGDRTSGTDAAPASPGPELNSDQRHALEAIRSASGYGTFLLDGVTGSGKTEIYLQLLRDVIARGKQALVLAPEIGLTPQLVARFRDRLGIEPAVLHSGLGDADRLRAWRDARSGAAPLVVGTRSAVFTPLPGLAVIVVDEEHDPSFKQQEGLRYSARDLAIARARHRDIPIVLGSATPTLEALAHCRQGRFSRLELPRRAGGAEPPSMHLVDLTRFAPADGLSEPLVDAIREHLEAHGQVLMFLNRRGFAPTLICRNCGHVAECRRCDSRMTVHAGAGQLRCHHCGAVRRLDTACEACGAEVVPLGEGTQRLEQALAARFPGRTVARIDSDSTQGRGAIDEALALAEQRSGRNPRRHADAVEGAPFSETDAGRRDQRRSGLVQCRLPGRRATGAIDRAGGRPRRPRVPARDGADADRLPARPVLVEPHRGRLRKGSGRGAQRARGRRLAAVLPARAAEGGGAPAPRRARVTRSREAARRSRGGRQRAHTRARRCADGAQGRPLSGPIAGAEHGSPRTAQGAVGAASHARERGDRAQGAMVDRRRSHRAVLNRRTRSQAPSIPVELPPPESGLFPPA